MKSFENILVEKNFKGHDHVALIQLNRPKVLNAISTDLLRDVVEAMYLLEDDKDVRVIILTGSDRAFAAGADIGQMMEATPIDQVNDTRARTLKQLSLFKKPLIAAVNGFALGGGFEMAMACDFIFASQNAVFGLPEVKLGLIPGFGGTQRLARIVGERRAKEIMFSGRNVKCEEAKSLGIVLESFADRAALMEGCKKWFGFALANSDYAIAKAKLTLTKPGFSEMERGLNLEAEEFGKIFQTPQMIEGTTAFVEKRKANFK